MRVSLGPISEFWSVFVTPAYKLYVSYTHSLSTILIPPQLYVFIGIVRRTFRPIEYCLGPVITRSISALSDAVILSITCKKTSYILKEGPSEGSPNRLASMLIKNGKCYVLLIYEKELQFEALRLFILLVCCNTFLLFDYTNLCAFLSIILTLNLIVIALDLLSVFMYVSTIFSCIFSILGIIALIVLRLSHFVFRLHPTNVSSHFLTNLYRRQ